MEWMPAGCSVCHHGLKQVMQGGVWLQALHHKLARCGLQGMHRRVFNIRLWQHHSIYQGATYPFGDEIISVCIVSSKCTLHLLVCQLHRPHRRAASTTTLPAPCTYAAATCCYLLQPCGKPCS